MQNNHNVYHLSERVSLETASFLSWVMIGESVYGDFSGTKKN